MNLKIIELFKEEIELKVNGTFYIVVNIEPYSKSNSLGFGNKIAFIPKRFKVADKILSTACAEKMKELKLTKFIGPIIMHIDGYFSNKRVFDAPNLPKSICDALNDVVYYDDRQIVLCTCTKHYDKTNPRIEIFIKSYNKNHDMVNMKPLLDKELGKNNESRGRKPKPEKKQKEGVQRVRKSNGTRKKVQGNKS